MDRPGYPPCPASELSRQRREGLTEGHPLNFALDHEPPVPTRDGQDQPFRGPLIDPDLQNENLLFFLQS